MKLCLIWPRSTFLIDPKVMPPLGLFYLLAALRPDHDCTFYDANNGGEIPDADAYLVSGTSPQAADMRRLAKILKERNPGASLIAGGPHATLCPDDVLAMGYDFAFRGEGERFLPGVLSTLPNLERGSILGPFPRVRKLDEVEWPDRSYAHLYSYSIFGRNATTMITSRGCPFRCDFCSHTVWSNMVTYRSAEDVAAEARYLKSMGWDAVMFYDDIFTLNVPRLREICRLLRPIDLWWRCFVRADRVTKGLFCEMADAGCVMVLCGVESGSQQILDNVNKGTTVEQNTRALQWAREAGVAFKALLILGLPGETEQTMQETERWVLENQPERLDIVTYVPFPNTPITNNPDAYDLHVWDEPPEEWWYKGPRDADKCMVSTRALSAERIAEKRLEILDVAGIPY